MIFSQKNTVVLVADIFTTGGIHSFMYTLSQCLIKDGNHVVLMGKSKKQTTNNTLFPGCEMFIIPENTKFNHIAVWRICNFILDLYAYAHTFSTISKKYNVTAIHFSHVISAFSILALCPIAHHTKKIYTFEGDRGQELHSQHIKHPIRSCNILLSKILQKHVLQSCSTIVAVSEHSKNYLMKIFSCSEPIIVIPNSIDASSIKLKTKFSIMRSSKAPLRILNISRFEPRKGHILLLRAMKLLLERGIDVTLTICGPFNQHVPPILIEYERLKLFNHVLLFHSVDEKQKEYLLQSTDLSVIPSLELETCPFAIIEALAYGIPVVGTPVGGIPEMLTPIDPKLVASAITPSALAHTIIAYHKLSFEQKMHLSRTCQLAVKKRFNANKNYHIYTKLYEDQQT